jgi:membrane protein DedA with SNARE-associated domain
MREPDRPHSVQTHTRRGRVVALVLLLAGLIGTYQFGWRSYGSFLALRSAYELGAPSVSTVRAWMTLDYVSSAYGVRLDRLMDGLDLPPDTSSQTPLFKIGATSDRPRFDIVTATQAVIAAEVAAAAENGSATTEQSGDTFLAALLTYSYPVLGLILLLGAIGAPVPTGFATVLAGVLCADGTMAWPLASAIAVIASVAGDIVGYGIGRLAGEGFVARHGHLFGYSGERKTRIEWLFHRWGGVTVLLTRTLVSHLSSLASLLAGLSSYAFAAFMAYAVVGRILWTAAYFGAGYYVGTDIEASGSFLANLTGLLIAASVAVLSAHHLIIGQAKRSVPTR